MEISSSVIVLLTITACVVDLCLADSSEPEKTVEYYTDRCLDGQYQKDKPGPESDLFGECAPWKDRSCCTDDIAEDLHIQPTWHNFNWNHCTGRTLSAACNTWLRKDLCFYECSPNVGPWLVPHNISIRNERFTQVPLCETDCNSWYQACRNDFTCKDNWSIGWNWTSGENKCPSDTTCETFETVYGSATNMCQTIWNEAYTVVPDSDSCMVLWFDPEKDNPNDEVALERAEELVNGGEGAAAKASSMLSLLCAAATLTMSAHRL